MAQTVIGLDIGTWSVKAAVLESGLRRFALQEVREHHVPHDAEGRPVDDLTDAVRATLAGVDPSHVLVTAVPGSRVMTRELTLPFSDDKKIQSVLGFQLEGQLPVGLDQLVVDYTVLEDTEEGAKLLCAAVDRTWFAEWLGGLKIAGLDPKIATLDTMPYALLVPHLAALRAQGPLDEDEDVAFIDLGHTTSSVCVVRQGRIETVRTLGQGGHHLTSALMEHLGLDYGQAEHVKHTGVRLDGHAPAGLDERDHDRRVEIIGRALAPIVRDVRTTLHAHRQRFGRPVRSAYLFGGTARMPGLPEAVGQGLGVEVMTPRVTAAEWSRVAMDRDTDLVSPKAVSLALEVGTAAAQRTINFRQGEFVFESDFKAIRDRAWWLAAMFVAILAVFFTRMVVHKGRLEEQHAKLVAELQQTSEKVLGAESENFETVMAKVASPPKDDAQEVFPRITALKALMEITAAQQGTNNTTPGGEKAPGPRDEPPPGADGEDGEPSKPADNRYKVEFDQVIVDQKSANIRGIADGIEAIEEFKGRLRKHPCFSEVDTTNTNKPRRAEPERADWMEFTVQLEIKCEQPEDKKKTAKRTAKADKSEEE